MLVSQREKRLKAIIDRVATGISSPQVSIDARRREAIQATLRNVQRKRGSRRGFQLRDALVQADLNITPPRFMAACAVSAALCALFASALSPIAALSAAIVGGIGVPRIFLTVLARRRLNAFTRIFPEALDIIIRGVRSGLPLGECIGMVAREMPAPVDVEFQLVTEGIRLGMTMEESLQRMVARVPTAEVRFFAIVIGIQQQSGGNLAETLAKLSDVIRGRKRMRDKIKAVSSEAKTSAAIIGSLPIIVAGMLMLIQPDYVGLLFTTSAGHLILSVSAVVMGIGIMVMRGMINFEI